ncbi:MAG: YajQ family cyclic di-GMP-binding protein [Candidatus Competibacteraceae bacterium]|nr:YajQ family cyclic di-GMP-binding protein [Candidatus Competibacteraceae bacterium]
MPSFDVVSEVNAHELSNAVDQTNREVTNRYDFKGADARVEQTENTLILHAESEFQIQQMTDILYQKLAKRGIDLGTLKAGALEASGKTARQSFTVRQGIDTDLGRKMVKLIKNSKLKVQAAIQGDQVRITGKKRDDLQAAIALLKETDLDLPLQFSNFRD